MAIERFFNRLGLRRDPTALHPEPHITHADLEEPKRDEMTPRFPGIDQYPEALRFLRSQNITPEQLANIYPDFEPYAESEFDRSGHAFRYLGTGSEKYRLDRVIFPEKENYDYILAAQREMRRILPTRIGFATIPDRSIRVNVYPDTSVALFLRAATLSNRVDGATFIIDPEGNPRVTDYAVRDSRMIHRKHGYEERPQPLELSEVQDPVVAIDIADFSMEFLERAWGMTEMDIAIPSAELARKIITAPVEAGVNLRMMV